ncbi:hypothetical protein F5B19DRAFT_64889 [Rostrohypoxylon terebratum]|nr:hypothetical protein F5B19DRAFT_64889 [Rostrohypoxylon terebratum]
MTARYELVSALLNIRGGLALEIALEHSLEMLQLNRADNQGVRFHVPALYLRLGRDQEAYDFVKWWTTGAGPNYNWMDMDAPYLNLHDQDIFEPIEGIAKELGELHELVHLTNIKVRLSLDIEVLAKEFDKPGKRNASYEEKMEFVHEHAATDILYKRRDIVERTEWSDILESLRSQIKVLYKYVKTNNRHYWPALRSPDRWAAAPITIYTWGSREEVNLVFRNTWYSWSECPAALGVVREMRA